VARRSAIRASDEDRESVVERLRQAAGEGRIAAHELEHRVTSALKARTYGELDATVSDLPRPASERRRRRRSVPGHAIELVRAHPALILVAIPVAAVVVAAVVTIAVLMAIVAIITLALGHRRPIVYRPYRVVMDRRRGALPRL
jgi:hypothetical protein